MYYFAKINLVISIYAAVWCFCLWITRNNITLVPLSHAYLDITIRYRSLSFNWSKVCLSSFFGLLIWNLQAMEAYILILEDFLKDWSHKERCIIEQNARYTQHSFGECKFFCTGLLSTSIIIIGGKKTLSKFLIKIIYITFRVVTYGPLQFDQRAR